MKIVLLGANGQLGKVIYEELRKDHEVIGTGRNVSYPLIKFNPFKDDWAILGKVNTLINCIGAINATKEFSFSKIHFGLTKLMMQNREILGNPKIIQISVLGASANHKLEFLKTKGIADEYLFSFPNTHVVRPSIICTPRTMLVKKLLMAYSLSKFSFGRILLPKGFLQSRIQPVMGKDVALLVSKLCIEDQSVNRLVNLPGPEEISYKELFEWLYLSKRQKLKIIELPKFLVDVLVTNIICPLFPNLINAQQYKMLFEDNIADKTEAEKYLGRPLTTTKDFWINEFQ